MQLEENTLVADRFRLIHMIGRGGMGSVWRAFDTRLDTPCAVKFIEGELANLAEAQARFQREAKAAAQLRSPYVVEIKDHGVWQGCPYIAMELLEGEDLGKALAKAGGKLPPAHVLAILQQVCRALTKAHAAGIVHRDLKPDNVFLVNDDDRQLVKILDFGVAKHASQTIDGSNTKTGAMLGTPYYMSPEQAQGIKSVDARSDLWALAVIVYQCITGRLPFESEALGDLLVKIIVQPIPVPSQVAQVPPAFDRWWAKAAERAPERRFQTAKELVHELEIALGDASHPSERALPAAPFQATAVLGPPAATGEHAPFRSTPYPIAPSSSQNIAPGFATPPPGQPTPSNMFMGSSGLGPNMAGGPATFSGVEPPTVVPKKGAPLAVIGIAVAVVLMGIGVAAALFSRSPSAKVGDSPAGSTSALAVAPPAAVEPAPVPTAEPASSAPASPSVEPVASAEPTAAPSASVSAVQKPPKLAGGGAKALPASASAKSVATAPTAKKKLDLGF